MTKILTVICGLAILTGPAAANPAAAEFWDFASERCIAPMENVVEPDPASLKMSARPMALVPSMTNTTRIWESADGRFFLARSLEERFNTCSAGLVDRALRGDAAFSEAVLEEVMALVVRTENGYALIGDETLDARRVVQLETREWREPRLSLIFFGDSKLGRLHIFVSEIDKEA